MLTGLRVATVACCLIALATPLGACGEEERPLAAQPLVIATGSPGGVYHAYGRGLQVAVRRHLPHAQPRLLATDASVENLRLVAARRAHVAFSVADVARDAVMGEGRFGRPLRLVALARLYDNAVQVVVAARSSIRALADLDGLRVSTGPPGSGTSVIAERVLRVAGIRARRLRLEIGAAANALAAGRIDALVWSGGLPTRALTWLRERMPLRLLGLGGVVRRLRARHGDLYSETSIPRSAYRTPRAVTTVSVPNYLVVRRGLRRELAYRLTRLLFRQRDLIARAHPVAARLTVRAAISTFPLALHPGASRFYRHALG